MRALLLALVVLAGCGPRETPAVASCESEAERDPVVADLVLKGAGSQVFLAEHQEQLKQARQRATLACLSGKSLIRPGGVEAQRPL